MGAGGMIRPSSYMGPPASSGSQAVATTSPLNQAPTIINQGGPIAQSAAPRPTVTAPAPAPAPAAPVPAPTTQVQVDPALTALQTRYNTYLNQLPTTQSTQMTMAAQASRDAAEGGRNALTESSAFRGESAAPALAAYDATTEQAEQAGIANEEVGNAQAMGSAITSGLGVEEAPTTEALAETASADQTATLGLNEEQAAYNQSLTTEETNFNQNLQAEDNDFNQTLATNNAARASAIYPGGIGSGGGGGVRSGAGSAAASMSPYTGYLSSTSVW